MGEPVNITEELVKRFDKLGYPCQPGTHGYYIVCCFINSNLVKLLGDSKLPEEDVELISTRYNLELTSTFYPDMIVFEINRTKDYVMINCINRRTGEEIFRIADYGTHVTNIIFDREDFLEHTYDVILDNTDTFTYRRVEVDGEERSLLFEGTLQSLSAKYKDREAFHLIRKYPPVPKSSGFVRRMKGLFLGEDYVNIVTSDRLMETKAFTDVIFKRLEEEADKFKGAPAVDGVKLEKK